MTTVLAVFVLALTTIHVEPQEKPRIPDDSVELTANKVHGVRAALVGERVPLVESFEHGVQLRIAHR